MKYFATPATDNERLLNYQYDYRNGKPDALGKMYELLFTIAYKTINNSKRGQDFSAADRKQKAHDAATYVIEQYITRPSFEIRESVTGYLHTRITRELNYARKCDKMLVYTSTLPERNSDRHDYEYIVTDNITGERRIYESAGELFLNPEFEKLKKCRLVECIQNKKTYKNYSFDVIEI